MAMPEQKTTWMNGPGAGIVDNLLARLLGTGDKQETRVSQIAGELARDIIEGRIEPGGDLNSIDLAKRFETSRTPVREALAMLENEGLVEIAPRRRPRAVVLPRKTVAEIYLLRAELYALVARRIVANASAAGIAELDILLDAMNEAATNEDDDGFFWNTVLFHEKAATIAGDLTLKRTIDGLGLRVLQLRHFGMRRSWQIDRSLRDHETLVAALKEGDSELAAAMNRSLVTQALDGLMKVYDNSRGSTDLPPPSAHP